MLITNCNNNAIALISFWFQFKTKGGSQLQEYCSSLTKEDCRRQSGSFMACEKVSKKKHYAWPLALFRSSKDMCIQEFVFPELCCDHDYTCS